MSDQKENTEMSVGKAVVITVVGIICFVLMIAGIFFAVSQAIK